MSVQTHNIYEQCRWALPIVQLWHMKCVFLKVIFKTHWPDAAGPDTFVNLQHGFKSIGRNFNATKCNFYPGHEGLKVVFDTLLLTSTLDILGDMTDWDLNSEREPSSHHSHMLSDLHCRDPLEDGRSLDAHLTDG